MRRWCAQRHSDVVGHLITRNWNHAGMANGAFGKDGDIRGAAANVHEGYTKLLLIFGEHCIARGQLL